MSLPPLNVPELLRRYSLRPDKSLGQNFLIDPDALQRVVEAAGITPQNDVLEIGPGLGSLTRLLAQAARQVVAVELDAGLIPVLQETLAPFQNVQIVQCDILALDPARLMQTGPQPDSGWPPYQVVANIPYYITSAVIRHLLEASRQPQRMVLTVQREVGERICATPGGMSLLALSVQVYGAPALVGRIPAGAFYPAPQVDSAVVRIDLYPAPLIPAPLLRIFFRLAKAGFSQKRKNLRNALAGGMGWKVAQSEALLQSAGIDPRRRAETLSLGEWRQLSELSKSTSAASPSNPEN
jgi:16S rRNA (adenine1518-N6/adenine1519-N6)-dimethyltransferase